MKENLQVIGLMSGTSADGIDVALIKTNGEKVEKTGKKMHIPYQDALRQKLKSRKVMVTDLAKLDHEVTKAHKLAIDSFLRTFRIEPSSIDLIGFHGHALYHDPSNFYTFQIGNGLLLAKETGIKVAYNFRIKDVAHGGEGAPLVPVYHQALFENHPKPLAILNIGGVANITYLGANGEIIASDVGPGNCLVDDYIDQKLGHAFDRDGNMAAKGASNEQIVLKYLSNKFYQRPFPKSLDRNYFDLDSVKDLDIIDGLATLTNFTAESISRSLEHFPAKPAELIITGGGRHNKYLMSLIKEKVKIKVITIDELGHDGDFIEAEAFAFLAARSHQGLPISFPTTTGVKTPMTGGIIVHPT